MRPHTRAEAAARARRRRPLAGALPRRARPAARVRCRRVLPARRSPVPRRSRTYDGFAQHENGIGMARTFDAEVRAALAGRRPGRRARHPQPGSSPGSTARPPTGYRAPRVGGATTASVFRVRDAGPRADRDPHRRVRRAGARAARCRARWPRRGPTVRLLPGRATGSSAATSPSPACSPAPTSAACSTASRPGEPRTCSPTSCSPTGAFLDGTTPDDLPAPGRDRRHRRRVARARRWRASVRAAGHASASPAPGRRRRRPSQRRQVDARQPLRRPARRDRRGAARRHPRPQGARRRVERSAVRRRRHRRVAAADVGRRRRAARPPGQRAGRAGDRRGRRDPAGRRRATSASPTRTRRVARILQRAEQAGPRWSSTRSTTTRREADVWDFSRLGLGDPVPGLGDARAGERRPARRRRRRAAADEPTDERRRRRLDDGIFSVAIVGRPNVGKSTLFNRLVGDERSIVHDMPGTTRDAIDTMVETEDGPLRFVDTAGMRRRSRIDEPTEYFSLVRALQAVDRADAALLVIDATEGVTPPGPAPGRAGRRRRHRDRRSCSTSGTCSTPRTGPSARSTSPTGSAFLSYAPVLTVSALTGRMTQQVLPALRQAEEAYHQRVPTAALNRVIRDGPGRPPAAGGRAPPAADPLRHPGRHRPAHVHALRHPRAAARRTCATSSARSARPSISGRRRSSCGSAAATAEVPGEFRISWLKSAPRTPTHSPGPGRAPRERRRDAETETWQAEQTLEGTRRGPGRDGDPHPRHDDHHVRVDRVLVGVPIVVHRLRVGPLRGPHRLGRSAAPHLRHRRRRRGGDGAPHRAAQRARRDVDLPANSTGYPGVGRLLRPARRTASSTTGSPRPGSSTPRTRPAVAGRTPSQNACDAANWDSVGVYVKLNHRFLTKLFGANITSTTTRCSVSSPRRPSLCP